MNVQEMQKALASAERAAAAGDARAVEDAEVLRNALRERGVRVAVGAPGASMTAGPAATPPSGFGGWLAEGIRRGPGSDVVTFGELGGMLGAPDTMAGGVANRGRQAQRALGANPEFAPQTLGGRIGLGVGQAMAAPSSYILGGTGAVLSAGRQAAGRATGLVASLFGDLLTAGASGAGAVVGGDVGQQVGESIAGPQGGQYGQFAGGMIGGATTGISASMPARALGAGMAIRGQAAMAGGGAMDTAGAVGDARAQAYVEAFLRANPGAEAALERAINQEAATGIRMPILSVFPGDAVLRALLLRRGAQDTAVANQYAGQVAGAEAGLQAAQVRAFGNPNEGAVVLDSRRRMALPGDANQFPLPPAQAEGLANAQRRVQRIAQAQEALAERVRPGANEETIGLRAAALVDARLDAARKAVRPDYDAAVAATGTIDASNLQTIHALVKDIENNRFMSYLPAEARRAAGKVRTLLEPADGRLAPIEGAGFTGLDWDELKRGVNRGLAKAGSDGEARRTFEALKSELDAVIATANPDAAALWRAADARYAEEVGMPFLNDLVFQRMQRPQLATEVLPKIISSREAARTFLEMGGDGAVPVLRDALASSLIDRLRGQGMDSITALRGWLASPQGKAAELVPELRRKVEAAVKLGGQSDEAKQALKDAEAAAADMRASAVREYAFSFGNRSPQAVADALMASPKEVQNFLREFGGDAGTLQAARSVVAERLLQSADPVATASEMANPAALRALFGDSEQYLRNLAELRRSLNQDIRPDEWKVVLSQAAKDDLERATGTSLPTFISIMRDRIASLTFKVSTLGSRALAAGAQRAEDAAVDRLVTDPNALLATIRAIKAGQQKKDWAAFAGEMLKDKRNRTALRSALSELAPPGRRVAAGAWIGAGTTVGAPPEPGGA
ncbi:hypothetical protein UFOVP411_51, partial [uncultured Caudovirales phage]